MASSSDSRPFKQLQHIWNFLRSLQIDLRFFIVALVLSLTAAGLEAISLLVLIPLIQGITTFQFGFVTQSQTFHFLSQLWPELSHPTNQQLFIALLSLTAITALSKNLFRYLSGVTVANIARLASQKLRVKIFGLYMSVTKSFFDHQNLGYLNQLLVDYTERITRPLAEGHQIVNATLSCLAYIGVLIYISWKLTLVVLVVFPLMVLVQNYMVGHIRRQSRILADNIASFSKKTYNILASIPLVLAYTTQARELAAFAQASERVAWTEYKMQKLQHLLRPLQETITLVAILVLVVGIALLNETQRSQFTGSFLVYFYVLLNAANSFAALQRMQGLVAQAHGPLEGVEDMLALHDQYRELAGHKIFTGLEQAITFKNVNFAYANQENILRNVSAVISKGTLTALVGASGGGKSTLINLLMHYYQAPAGTILIDGVPIEDYTVESLRRHIALVSQDTVLFNDTLRANLLYGLDNIADDTLEMACTKARLQDLLERLPDKFETMIGDRGVKVSGGERQRIAIARALLKGAEIILLDEATSALDSTTERLVQEAIDEALHGKTSIVVAHRLSTIKHADQILVLENGQIVEHGTLSELLAKQGLFYTYWQAQKFD